MGKLPGPDPNRPWYSDGLRFTCTQCGHCCTMKGYVWVGPAEIEAMARFLQLDERTFRRKYLRKINGHSSLTEKANFECIFWEGGCTIYSARPTQCRTFPFWNETLRNPGCWEAAAQSCPGIGSGRAYSCDEVQILRRGHGETGRADPRRPERIARHVPGQGS